MDDLVAQLNSQCTMVLSAAQKTAITSTWPQLSADKATMETNGAKLFALLFAKFPDTKGYFTFLPGTDEDEIKGSGVGRAHALAVFTGLGAFVLALDDQEALDGLGLKWSRNHFDRKIGPDRMGQMREVFGTFLDQALGDGATGDVKAAWDTFLGWLQDKLAHYK